MKLMSVKHGMTGKKNAKKPDADKNTAYIHIRCHPQVKDGAVKTALNEGKTLSRWIVDLIKQESKY